MGRAGGGGHLRVVGTDLLGGVGRSAGMWGQKMRREKENERKTGGREGRGGRKKPEQVWKGARRVRGRDEGAQRTDNGGMGKRLCPPKRYRCRAPSLGLLVNNE